MSFIDTELIPYIDRLYKTDSTKRVLMGHSLGGYFSVYALLQHLNNKSNRFSSYVAASPFLHYNHYYLLNKFKELSSKQNNGKKIKAYITYGGEEDAESKTDSSVISLQNLTNQLDQVLTGKHPEYVSYKSDIFSNLDHMDTQLPTFVKGLQWTLSK